ncbi:thyroglobulin [Heteronotia binoei]|uniref:thyroglobulin n=1 Tax=Heteronotia binoei TaxID=13085 RepID=UPI0029308A18|nr:thyroglobulin [Heteronotia binoei]
MSLDPIDGVRFKERSDEEIQVKALQAGTGIKAWLRTAISLGVQIQGGITLSPRMDLFLLNTFLCFINIAAANIFEYQAETQPLRPCELQREKAFRQGEDYVPQCLEDGQFRNVQCDNLQLSCWCVDENGVEVPGSKQTGSSVACLSFCQLQKQRILVSRYINSSATTYIPQCLDSGDFDSMQCDLDLQQCWCVDGEGMEIYGTRQRGKPARCPGKCEIRDRRVLHGVGEKSPPQCSADGEFLPVQCKFVNRTDMMVFDLLHHFNRFPEAFLAFSAFSNSFPEISGYCYCADSLGRELEETGLEMLLDNVYDTIFASTEPAQTFSDTTMYRILQRRFLGVRLLTFGRFKCPSKCEMERFSAVRFQHKYKPSCDENGAYEPTQCQPDGQCWCVDSKGQEILGTRSQGQRPPCGEEHGCASERQRALSTLFYGPIGHFGQHNLFSAAEEAQKATGFSRSCSPSLKKLFVDSGLLSSVMDTPDASQLLRLESVLSEAIRGIFPSRELARVALRFTSNRKQFQENLFGGKFLKNLIQLNFTGAIGTNSKFNLERFFQQSGTSGEFAETRQQILSEAPLLNLSRPLVDSLGQMINLQDNQRLVKFLASLLKAPEFFAFLQQVISIPESIAEDLGDVAKIVLRSQDCQEKSRNLFIPECTKDGKYKESQCYAGDCWCVDSNGKELSGSRVHGTDPKCPSLCEKQRESLQSLKRSQPAGSELFVPSCTSDGKFLTVQCHGRNCFCVNSEGRTIPGIAIDSRQPVQCPSDCQLAGSEAFLRTVQKLLMEPTSLPQFSSVYIPQCTQDGEWRRVQCDGPPEHAFEWYQMWITQNNNGRSLPLDDLMDILLDYKERSRSSFEVFVKALYEAGHQNVFPVFSRYPSFEDVPQVVREGNNAGASSANILLVPFTFWQLLQGQLIHYPGPYSDFSNPLEHFDLRGCWCVDEKGQMQGSKAEANEFPDCPGACKAARQEATRFTDKVERLIRESNSSRFPFGQSFLMAEGLMLTEDELLNYSQPGITFSEGFLTGRDYAIRLAAQSTLHFYWRHLFASRGSAGEATRLGFQPYVPQCDGLGNWEPLQCYDSSGHCWCVDERGRYVSDSLVTRLAQLPQCRTPCQRSQTNALISGWRQKGPSLDLASADLFTPSCLETGAYAMLQKSETEAWCVDPASGEVLQGSRVDSKGRVHCPGYCSLLKSKTLSRELGRGYLPKCESSSGVFSPVQCDDNQESCWCVFENGAEAPGTRDASRRPECERPQCRLPFDTSDVVNGQVFCNNTSLTTTVTQQCWVICYPGFHRAFSSGEMFLCDVETKLWVGDPPHLQTCQKLQPFQTVQVQSHFQLLLPAEKACSPDYSGLLEAFEIFILDEMKARGLCHLQVNALERLVSVPVCSDSAVRVECLSADRLGVNVMWTAVLEDIPAASLPDLHNVEEAMAGDLMGRFESLLRNHGFVFHLDSKRFQADTSVSFPRDVDFNISSGVYLGCKSRFQKVLIAERTSLDSQGCVVCPPGAYFQNDHCIPCPSGSYQEQSGSLSCPKCPSGKTTVSPGAFKAEHCITACQMDSRGLQCDGDGRYESYFEDSATNKSFCVDSLGKILEWTETDSRLTVSQCLVLRRFESVPAPKLSVSIDEAEIVRSETIQGEPSSVLWQCVSECEKDESCGFVALSSAGTGRLCELYSSAESNYNCSASGLAEGVFENSATTRIARLSCLIKVRSQDPDTVRVYLKKGQEFTAAGAKTFERTDFQDVVSGVYRNLVLSAAATSLTDAHLFCRQSCSQNACCDGFILSQVPLDGGSILCGLMSYPDVFICHANDWDGTPTRGRGDQCQREKYAEGRKQYTFQLGGQVLTETSGAREEKDSSFISFQRVYLWRDSDMVTRLRSSACDAAVVPAQREPGLTDSALELFSLMENSQIQIDRRSSLPSQEYWIFKHTYSAEQASLWCLTRCAEDEFCQLADIANFTSQTYFTCTLYPVAQVCENIINSIPENCSTVLPQKPNILFQKTVSLEGSVKNFYTRLPFRKVSGISVRNKMDVSGKAVGAGFLDCERLCDADPCCTGFGLLNASQATDGKVLCLILNSLGIQTCSEELRNDWHVSDCAPLETEARSHPFGWYQKGADVPDACPPVHLSRRGDGDALDKWQRVEKSSILTDPSISQFDILHLSREAFSDFASARDLCLSVCSENKSCLVTTVEIQRSAARCMFYPETQSCRFSLQEHHCQLLLKEPATYIYRRQDVFPPISETSGAVTVSIPSLGVLYGASKVIQVGSNWKSIRQFLGIPYAAPPLGENRFRPPQVFTRAESWNATMTRASCWQPGDDEVSPSSISEDCLYLNIYVPDHTGGNLPVLVFFHNGVTGDSDQTRILLDGSYLAAVGNIVVVTVNYRVGVFGFLSTGSSLASGNWGLLDQEAALKWTQGNIASFGGDPGQVTAAADRSGADIASLHLLAGAGDTGLFKRALLMGGSAFSPASVIGKEKAREQAADLAAELGCPSADGEESLSCLRQLPAKALNDAQTKRLAVSGPFQYWSPVVDGVYLQEPLTSALQRSPAVTLDLLIGSSQQDGLISRAKAIKRFEESQGRSDSKTIFYRALQNSLGGEDSNPMVLDAASWFYSLQHSSDNYASFSRALENATRDHFIICPTIEMAKRWAGSGRGNVFMYHVPESSSLSSSSLELLPDVQYIFGLPFHPLYENRYTLEEKTLSLAIMQYLANFMTSGNPNNPYKYSRRAPGLASPWPMFRADAGGDNYKEFTAALKNRKGLKEAECSFWFDYIKTLKVSTGCGRDQPVATEARDRSTAEPVPKTTRAKPAEEKAAYSK